LCQNLFIDQISLRAAGVVVSLAQQRQPWLPQRPWAAGGDLPDPPVQREPASTATWLGWRSLGQRCLVPGQLDCDGIHVDPVAMRIMMAASPDRSVSGVGLHGLAAFEFSFHGGASCRNGRFTLEDGTSPGR
jgi:hypothetical protein